MEKRSRGRPAHIPTEQNRKLVERMAAVGITHNDISRILGINKETLEKHYREEIDNAMIKANASVAGALYQSAMKGNVTAQIFWCKTRLGWKEVDRLEHSGQIQFKPVIEFVKKTK